MHLSWVSPPTGFASSSASPPPVFSEERLMKELETTGTFWLPQSPATALWGKISFEPGNGVVLDLEGNLFSTHKPFGSVDIPVIHGQISGGTPCSIFSGWGHVNVYTGDREYPTTQVTTRLAVAGGLFANESDCTFDSAQLKLSHLDEWFEAPYDIRHKRGSMNKSLITFKPDELVASFRFQDIEASLGTFCARSVPILPSPKGVSWPYSYQLTVRPTHPQDVRWYVECASKLRDLFVFLIGSAVYTLDLIGWREIDRHPKSRIEVWHPVVVPRTVRTQVRYFSTRLDDYRDAMPGVIELWFQRLEELKVVTECYTELLCADGIAPNSLLLRTAQTLEHLHGLLWPDDLKYAKRSTFNRLIQFLSDSFPREIEQVPPEEMEKLSAIKKILLDRIGNLNELSFRSRIERLLREIPGTELMPILGNPRDLDGALTEFLTHLEGSRHYLSHFDDRQKAKAFPSDKIEEADLICWAALTFWIAKELGLSESQAGDIALGAKNALFLIQSPFAL